MTSSARLASSGRKYPLIGGTPDRRPGRVHAAGPGWEAARGLLAVDCAAEDVPYGMLASGGRLRLFRFTAELGAPATTTTFLELDTATLRQQDRPLLGLLAPCSLRSDGHLC